MALKNKLMLLFFIVFSVILAPMAYPSVAINEILANGFDDPESEWIEIYNSGGSAVNLTGWNISETSSRNFTLNTGISANEFIILTRDSNTFNLEHPNLAGIKIINITVPDFSMADTSGEVILYNSSGALVDKIVYAQASGKSFENVSIGRHPDGASFIFNLSTITPGAKNDKNAPSLNKWLIPSANSTRISSITNITANITDDATAVNSSIVNFNSTNYSMSRYGDLWYFVWNTSQNEQKAYNITIYFNDSYGKSATGVLFNITVNNSPFITGFSPSNLVQTIQEGSLLTFTVNASDPDDNILNFSWYLDNLLIPPAQNQTGSGGGGGGGSGGSAAGNSNNAIIFAYALVQNSINQANFTYSPDFSENGTHSINITIKDSSSSPISLKWTVIVSNFNRAPVLENISNKIASKNINLSFNITAADPDNDTLIFSSNHSGIAISKINNSIATVSWKPTNLDLGNHTINFTVSDGISADYKKIIIAVNVTDNSAPIITTLPGTTAELNEKYTYNADAADADGDVLFYSLSTNASGMSIGTATGFVSFLPSSLGFFAVNISASDLTEISSQSYNLTVREGSGLKIIDIDVKIDGKKRGGIANNTRIGREARPESDLEFKIKIKNNFPSSSDMDIEDIEVRATIEGIDDDDDLEEESKTFDLGPQRDKTATLKFALPLNIDEGAFDVIIDAEGEDTNGAPHRQHFEIELEVEKEKHDLRILGFDVSPMQISCGSSIIIGYGIMNLGQEDEEEALFEVTGSGLGLDYRDENLAVGSGTEDNLISKNVKLALNDELKKGAYKITANAYSDDGRLRDTKAKEIQVRDCISSKESKGQQLLSENGNAMKKETSAAKKPAQAKQAQASFKDSDYNMGLLALSTLVFTSFFVVTAVIVVGRA